MKEKYHDENRPDLVAMQLEIFCHDIKKGDIVLLPSDRSSFIHFGIVKDEKPYEDNISIEWEDKEEIESPHGFRGAFPNRKRRKVEWLKVVKKSQLYPQLYNLLYSSYTITNADKYAEYIDKSLYDFYVKGDRCHFILHVRKQEDIKAQHLIMFMSDLLSIAEVSNKDANDELEIKVNVQSSGAIELIGQIPNIIFISLIVVAILGGKTKFFGLELDTPGIVGRILEWMKTRKEGTKQEVQEVNEITEQLNEITELTDEQKERLLMNAENLDLMLPEQLQEALKKYYEDINRQNDESNEGKQKSKEVE